MAKQGSRVLVVDDDSVLRNAIGRMLTAASFIVEKASDGAEMLDRVTAGESFDFILMDLEMPRMDGRAALARLQQIAPELAKRTLIMTGGSSVLELQTWIESLGPGRVLFKPFSPRLLEEMLADLVA